MIDKVKPAEKVVKPEVITKHPYGVVVEDSSALAKTEGEGVAPPAGQPNAGDLAPEIVVSTSSLVTDEKNDLFLINPEIDIDVAAALINFDAPRILGTSNPKQSVAKVVGDNVYIASLDAIGNPVLVIILLDDFLSNYG